jgi:hypothetical protein
LKNLDKPIQKGQFKLGRLVAQGGFDDDNIVPEDKRLDKFNGRVTFHTFYLGDDTKPDQIILDYDGIKQKVFLSKNNRNSSTKLEKIKHKSQSFE